MTLSTNNARIGLMLDIETLGTGPDAVVWQTALTGWDLLDPETLLDRPHFQYLPIDPQVALKRVMSGGTILYWMREVAKEPAHVEAFAHCDSDDYGELQAYLNHFIRTFERMTQGVDYELWTRGNFDVPIMENLLTQCGLRAPWDFRKLRDLRTLEAVSGVSYKDVPQPTGFIKHRADWDTRFQIKHHTACMAALGQR